MLKTEERTLPLPEAYVTQLKQTQQNPRYHAEGNVYQHTLMVLDSFQKHADTFGLSPEEQEIMYWACILHDIGKPKVTRPKNGSWSARGHEKAGVPIARNLLFQQPHLNAEQRQRILELVKYHNLPLWWGLDQKDITVYKHLATRTDLRLLGIFAYFDILGRICEQKKNVLSMVRELIEKTFPQVAYELGSYTDLRNQYTQSARQAQNALWKAVRLPDMDLVEKLLQAEFADQHAPRFECVMSIGLATAAQTAYLQSHYPNYIYFHSDPFLEAVQTPQELRNKIREIKRFLSVYAHAGKAVLLDGSHLNEELRSELAAYIRQLGGRLRYLFFDQSLDQLLENSPEDMHDRFQQKYELLDCPHPWEANHLEIVTL